MCLCMYMYVCVVCICTSVAEWLELVTLVNMVQAAVSNPSSDWVATVGSWVSFHPGLSSDDPLIQI